jgi:hypothetical protein
MLYVTRTPEISCGHTLFANTYLACDYAADESLLGLLFQLVER